MLQLPPPSNWWNFIDYPPSKSERKPRQLPPLESKSERKPRQLPPPRIDGTSSTTPLEIGTETSPTTPPRIDGTWNFIDYPPPSKSERKPRQLPPPLKNFGKLTVMTISYFTPWHAQLCTGISWGTLNNKIYTQFIHYYYEKITAGIYKFQWLHRVKWLVGAVTVLPLISFA